jgi:hypothetical protein
MHTASGMLMQEVEVRSSVGSTFVLTDATIWQALQVRLNATQVRSNVALHCFSVRDSRSHVDT